MMKTVWILNHYAVPPSASGGTRHFGLAKNLPLYGWQACIIAASVEHLTGKQRLASGKKKQVDIYDDVCFLWLKASGYVGNGAARARNMLEFALRALLPKSTLELPRPDVIIGSSVHPFTAISGAFLAKRFGVPFVFEVRDLWPQTLIDLGRIAESSVSAKVMRSLERWLYRRADRIITLLPRAVDYIVPMAGVLPTKIIWIANGVDLSNFPDSRSRPGALNQTFDLMYFGAHGQANGLKNLLLAMKSLAREGCGQSVHLRLIGDGPAKLGLQEVAKQLGLDNVTFEPPVTKADIPRLAAEADAFVLTVPDRKDLYKFGISPNKMYDYLAACRPIILASAAINNPVRDAGAGITVPPDDPEAMAGAIRQLVALPLSERVEMGVAGRRYVEQHNDFKALARQLAAMLDDCVAERRRNT